MDKWDLGVAKPPHAEGKQLLYFLLIDPKFLDWLLGSETSGSSLAGFGKPNDECSTTSFTLLLADNGC